MGKNKTKKQNVWYHISTGTGDARLETVISEEMEQAIKYAANTCSNHDHKLNQCFD